MGRRAYYATLAMLLLSLTVVLGGFPHHLTGDRTEGGVWDGDDWFVPTCASERFQAVVPPSTHVFYHVAPINNWAQVLTQQMATLCACGWDDVVKTVSVHGGSDDVAAVQAVVLATCVQLRLSHSACSQFRVSSGLRTHKSQAWETDTLVRLHQHCSSASLATEYVVYIHSKGVSRWKPDWRLDDTPWTYSRSFYWRRFMEWYVLENTTACVAAFNTSTRQDKVVTCGVDWRGNHYSGNFWWARCDFVRRLPLPCQETNPNYVCPEVYIGGTPPSAPRSAEWASFRHASVADSNTNWRNDIYYPPYPTAVRFYRR